MRNCVVKLFLALLGCLNFYSHFLIALQFKPIPEKELPKTKEQFVRKFLTADDNRGEPAVFRGYAKNWPATKKWSPKYFAEKFSDFKVKVQIDEHLTGEFGPVETKYKKMDLKTYVSQFHKEADEIGYLSQFSLAKNFPTLLSKLNFPQFFSHRYLSVSNFWLGPKGTKSKLHYDSDQNFFVQIYGTKLVRLISPKFKQHCYPINKSWYDAYSPIDIENPDFKKYPLFKEVEIFEAELGPGDMLYIPKYWWHDIRSLTPSISANFWWISWIDFLKELYEEAVTCFFRKQGHEFNASNSYLGHFIRNLKNDWFARP
jgi:hypothetical protein